MNDHLEFQEEKCLNHTLLAVVNILYWYYWKHKQKCKVILLFSHNVHIFIIVLYCFTVAVHKVNMRQFGMFELVF